MHFSVLQWNAWNQEDSRNIATFLMQQKPDIICLQEMSIDDPAQFINNGPKYIAEQLGYNYFYQDIAFKDESAKQANGIFSRFPVSHTSSSWINQPTGTGKYDDEPRALVKVRVTVGNRTITIATAHMSYTHRFESTPRKRDETDALIAQIAKHREAFILTGDLNAINGSYTINSLGKYLKNAGPAYSEHTWTTKPFSYDGFEETQLNWRLDHIFATSDMKPVSTKILKTDFSDHLPIMTVFDFVEG